MRFAFLSHICRRIALPLCAMVILSVSPPCRAQTAPPVPVEFQDLYSQVQGDLDAFNATLTGLGAGPKYPVRFTGELTNADANGGSQLVNPGYFTGVQTQLQMLKAMGVSAVAVRVDFPMLYQPFFSSQADYQQYVNFYTQVSSSVKALGLKLVVENTCLLSSGDLAGWATQLAPFLPTLNWTTYQAARAQTAQTITQVMQPDYLVIVEEPDNEAFYCGQPNANTPSGSVSLVDQIHSSVLLSGFSGVQVGAGVGAWLTSFQDFINGYTGQQCSPSQPCVSIPLDFIDMHLYPVNNLGAPSNNDFLANALTIAQMAAAAGKPVSMSEAWAWKVRDSEYHVLAFDDIWSRNAFDFWAPLDAYFLQTMETFANYAQMPFFVPFSTQDFAAYVPYNSVANSTASQIYSAWFPAAAQAMNNAAFTSTALNYYNAILAAPDTTPPSAPTNAAGISNDPSSVNLTWNAATDDVGVAGYNVSRNGGSPVATALTSYTDTGRAGGTAYTYTIQAFDLGGNMSTPASVTVTTKPAAPATVTATAVSTQEIDLAWTAAAGAASYRVFQGTSPAALTQIATVSMPATSYAGTGLVPATLYYFAVETVDASGNVSPMSAVASATTLALPSAPTNLAATAVSTTQINLTWTAGSSRLPVVSYNVFRGSSPSALSRIGSSTGTSYSDTGLTLGTIYYYAVQEVDTAGNLSPLSATVSAMTLGPSAPGNLTATAVSTSQINLSWSASSGSAPIAGYQVFRGTSASNLIQVATVTTTTYNNTGLAPSTTFYFAVKAVDTSGNVSSSAVISAITLALPSAPTNVVAAAVSTTQINLTWAAGPSGLPLTGYYVSRGTSPSTLTRIATPAGTSYADKSLTSATTYYYAVREVDTAGNISPTSATVSATTFRPPSAPATVTATPATTTQINLSWSAAVSGGAPIASYRVSAGTSPSTLSQIASVTTLTYAYQGLTASTTYYFAIQAVDTLGNVSPMSAVVSATTLALPSPPATVTATPVSPTQINLTWPAASSGAAIASYRVFAGTAAASLSQIASVSSLTYADQGLSASTNYYFAVESVDTLGNVSPMSAVVSAATLALPSAPTNLAAAAASTTQINLTWTAGPSGLPLSTYNVFRGNSPSTLSQIASVTAAAYADKSLTVATSYYYAVQEVDTGGNVSPLSVTVPATTLGPTAPTGLTATAASSSQVNLTWSASSGSSPIAGYRVFAGSSPSNLVQIASPTTTTYSNTGLAPSTTYYYAVAAVDTLGNVSLTSAAASTTTLALAPPANLAASAASPNQINLTWTAPSVPLSGYNVLRGTSPSSLSKIASSTVTSYSNTGLTPSTTYYYAVQSVDLAGNVSAQSATVSTTTLAGPSTPTGVTATASSTSQINLSWSASTGGAPIASYRVFAGTSASSLTQIASPTGTSYSDTGLAPATTYYFAVESVDTLGNVSPMSAVVSATTQAAPSAPTNLTTVVSTNQVNLTWTPGPSGLPIASYYVSRGTSPSTLSRIAIISGTTYADKSLTPATTYYYAVREVDTAGNISPLSVTVSATTYALPTPPAMVTATAVTTSQINVAWPAASGGAPIASYRVFAGSSPSTLSQIASVTALTYSYQGLTASTTYYFGVEAVDTFGNVSPLSAVVSATTLALPSAPTNLAATAASTSQINLTWTAGPSGLPLASFTVLRGSSPTALIQIATTTAAAYADKGLAAGTTYYYSVQETDQGGNVSPLAAPVPATTLSGPSAPANLTATVVSSTLINLSWLAASPSGAPVANYLVFAGSSPTTLSQIANPPTLSYADQALAPSTTYYFGVEAVDTLGNVSQMSVVVSATTPVNNYCGTSVPSAYLDVCNQVTGDLDSFNFTLNGLGAGSSKYPVNFTGVLTNADADDGPQLGNPGYITGVQTQIQMFKAMGVSALAVRMDFPMLYQPFFTSQSDYQRYVDFYSQVSGSVKAAGLKLIVENTCMIAVGGLAGWAPQLATFLPTVSDWTTYQAARAQTAQTIAQVMQPDYMVIVEEPDNEALYCQQPNANTPGGSVSLLDQIHASVQQAGVPGIQIGAGVGTWLPNYQSFINAYAQQQCSTSQPCVSIPLDFIDMHIYPINNEGPGQNNFLGNALAIAQTAAAAGKPVAISESWDFKVRDSELGVLTPDQMMSRNAFDFWAPVDAYFLQTMGAFANYAQMPFFAQYCTPDFSAYQPYSLVANLLPVDIYNLWFSGSVTAMNNATFTSTALSYYHMLVSPPDTIAPSAPTNAGGASGDPASINLTWTASTDNIGVAGYYVSRNGGPPVATANAFYQDTGLTGSTTYTYTIQAFDLAGNLSTPPTSVSASTKDTVPPAAPATLAANAVSPQEIDLAWPAATDDVGVAAYRVFSGTSPSALIQVATVSTTSYARTGLSGSTTYYFGVQAVDTSGNVSPMSPVVSATTLAPPSPPTNLNATVVSTTQINLTWTAGPSGLPVASYNIFRGNSLTTLTKVASSTAASYNDPGLTVGTTYYYSVQEVDNAGNVSQLSAPDAATTLGPSAPANLTATPVSPTQINLDWSPSSGSSFISRYYVFAGTSASNLAQIASPFITSYNDQGLAPSTTYYFAVEAVDTQGAVSVMSAVVSVATLALPSAPTSLAATVLSPNQIKLTWAAGPSGLPVSSYNVLRGSSPSNLSQIGSTTSTSYTDQNLAPVTTYYYAVQEVDSGGNVSPQSGTLSATTLAGPTAPANLTATPISPNQINLSWSASTGGAPIASYQVLRGTSPSNLSQIATPTGTTYSSVGLNGSTTYYFAVKAVDTFGNVSPQSAVVSAATLALPSAPTNLTATAVSTSKINLTWTWTAGPGGLPLANYNVLRGNSPSTLSKIGSSTSTSYSDLGLTLGTIYYYAVQAVDTGGNVSPQSATVSAMTQGPAAPGNLTATAVSTSQINLSWSASVSGAPIANYLVFRGSSPSSLSQIASVTGTSYNNTGLTAGTTYYYAVEAVDTFGNISPMSAVVSATTQVVPPSPPTNLSATTPSSTQVKLTWTAAKAGSLPLASYSIYRGSSAFNLTPLATINSSNLSYSDFGLRKDTTYYYAVQSVDTGGNVSSFSSTVSITTPHH